jgi:hexosaminidase
MSSGTLYPVIQGNVVYLSLLVIVGAIAFGGLAAAAPTGACHVIPLPGTLQVVEGEPFRLMDYTVIVADASLAPIAASVATALDKTTGHLPAIVAEAATEQPSIRLVRAVQKHGPVAGAYRLTVRTREIRVEADAPEGFFHAAQTLRQLATRSSDGAPWMIPLVDVLDQPRFRWRGLLVDVAAHFWPKEMLKRIIDDLALYKMNVLHLHLTDYGGWRVEVPSYPKLTAIGGRGNLEAQGEGEPRFYSKADVREIVAYAAENFVTVVPEIEMPGHAGAAARAYPEFFDDTGTFNPAACGVYDFIAAIVADVARQFPGPYFHFGGDEVNTEQWSKLPEIALFMRAKGLKTAAELQRYFYGRVAKIIQAAGKRPMAWDETAEAGVGPEVTIQWWRKAWPEVHDRALANGVELVLSPVDQIYLDYAPGPGELGSPWEGNDNGPTSIGNILSWEPVPANVPEARLRQIAGIEAALWTQFIHTESFLQFMLYPRLLAVAEVAWRPRGPRDTAEFQRRLAPHVERLRAEGINARRHAGDAQPSGMCSRGMIRHSDLSLEIFD